MHQYTLSVPIISENLTTSEVINNRLESFNNNEQYIVFDNSSESAQQFILVSKKDTTEEDIVAELKSMFDHQVAVCEIKASDIDDKTNKKIQTAKRLMITASCDDDYRGKKKPLLVTETITQIFEAVNNIIGFSGFKKFFNDMDDYIDRIVGINVKAMHNIAFVNKSGACLDEHVELLYKLFCTKGSLDEHVIIKGDVYDARYTDRETRFLYHIDDNWDRRNNSDEWGFGWDEEDDTNTDDNEGYPLFSNEVKLLNRIIRSNNIYVTSLNPEVYNKISKLECFGAAFPNVVCIDEFSVEEKLESIRVIADEYGFSFEECSSTAVQHIKEIPAASIEMTVRKAITRKLISKDDSFSIGITDIVAYNTKSTKQEKRVSAFEELESLIGLEGVKGTVKEIVTFLKKRGKSAVPCMHMAFLGSPGTAKTTVARIVGRIFHETGSLKKDVFVETDRSGLVGEYVGQTAVKTRKKVESALGGVLFIDEAYSMFVDHGIDYGKEVISTLVKLMEDKRDEFICILAGYTEETNRMLSMNPGLRDRIQFYIDFPDYNEYELLMIFERMCKENKYKLSQSARKVLKEGFSQMLKTKHENFSNGRLVRKIFERARIKQAIRSSSNIIINTDINAVFVESDMYAMFEDNNQSKIGFIC